MGLGLFLNNMADLFTGNGVRFPGVLQVQTVFFKLIFSNWNCFVLRLAFWCCISVRILDCIADASKQQTQRYRRRREQHERIEAAAGVDARSCARMAIRIDAHRSVALRHVSPASSWVSYRLLRRWWSYEWRKIRQLHRYLLFIENRENKNYFICRWSCEIRWSATVWSEVYLSKADVSVAISLWHLWSWRAARQSHECILVLAWLAMRLR